MKFDDLDEQDKEILLNKKYKPVSELFGEGIKNWYYYDLYTDSPKKEVVQVNGNIHKIPVRGHVYIFRWMMPKNPCVYGLEDVCSDEAIRLGIFRYTVGGNPFLMSEDEIKKIARGEISVSQDYIQNIRKQMEKVFKFDTWKIPVVHVSADEWVFTGAWGMYEGFEKDRALALEQNLILKQEEKKKLLLEDVKGRLESFPDYLSIVRSLVQEKISMESAVQQVGPNIIVKGI